MGLRIAFVLAISITLMAQGTPSTTPAASQTEIREQQGPPATVPGASTQAKKHARPAPTATATPNAEENTKAESSDSTLSTITKQPLERWIQIYLAITGVLALIALGALGVMRRQLSEMRDGRRQTDALIKRAIEQASALQDFSDKTDRLVEQAIEHASIAAEQARAANMAACAAKSSSENFAQVASSSVQSIQLAQEAMRLEQRAWVFVTETKASKLQVGQPLSISIAFKNTGRTPARNVQIAAHLEPLPKGQAPEPKLDKTQSRGVIPPNGTLFLTISTGRKHAEGVTEQGLEAIASGELVIWVYGTVTYEDIFETRQATMFCYMLHPDGKTFAAAEVYNDAT